MPAHLMNANIAAALYLVAGVLFIMALRGLSSPESSRRGNMFGMIGMAIAVGTTLALHPPVGLTGWVLVVGGIGHRRRHRRGDRAPRADDLNARTGRGLPLAGRHGGGAGRGGRVLCAGGLRHRHTRQHPQIEPRRDVARRRHRRADVHRLGHRVPEAVGPHERQADHVARPPHHQHRACGGDGVLHLRAGRVAEPDRFLAGHGASRWCSASSSSSRSAAPTCRS